MTTKRVIGIDPGTKCGWSVFERFERGELSSSVWRLVASGVWDLKGGRHEGGGMRFLRMRRAFEELIGDGTGADTRVGYEEVRRHAGTDAAHIYGGIVGMLTAACEERSIPYLGIPVSTIKRCATSRGNADKTAMMAAARERWPHVELVDDNEADARFIGVAMLAEVT